MIANDGPASLSRIRHIIQLGCRSYVLRSIGLKRHAGIFLVWNAGTYIRLAENRQLPAYSRRLREAREAYGISQRNLGIDAGLDDFVASTRINRSETGVHQPDLQILQRLAAVLGLPVAYFYAEDDRSEKHTTELDSLMSTSYP